jgi:hypothetical protein
MFFVKHGGIKMKKNRIAFFITALICAGIIMTACPSDPEGGAARLGNTDIAFDLIGEYWYTFIEAELGADYVKIEKGKIYELILDVKDVDDDLAGCHFQGQLYYELGGKRYLLAGSQNAQPQNIADFGKKYRMTFVPGDYSSGGDGDEEDSAEKQAEGEYEIPADPSTPDGAIQKLKLTVKTPQWYRFGIPFADQPSNGNDRETAHELEGVDFYRGDAEGAGLVGSIIFRVKPQYTYLPGEAVIVNDGRDSNGKGNITTTEFEKLQDAPANSVLRCYCTANLAAVGTGGAGGSRAEPGWGIAEFGPTFEYKRRGQNISTGVIIPRVWNGATLTAANPAFNFYTDVLIEDILSDSELELVFLNVYNSASVNNMVIMTPSLVELPPEIVELLELFQGVDKDKLRELLENIDEILAMLP